MKGDLHASRNMSRPLIITLSGQHFRCAARAGDDLSRRKRATAAPSSPSNTAAVRMWCILGAVDASRPPIAAQTAHEATCDVRTSITAPREPTALRAVALPAARHRAERLATSCLTSAERGTCSHIAIPRRANAAVPALRTGAAWVAFRRSRQTAAPLRRVSHLDMPGGWRSPLGTAGASGGRRTAVK